MDTTEQIQPRHFRGGTEKKTRSEMMELCSHAIQWLLEEDDPSVRFRTLTELLRHDDCDPDVIQARSAISQSKPVLELLEKMHPDGYWLQMHPRTQAITGDGVEYGAFGTTHFCLAYLAELGMDRSHPQVEQAAQRYLALQKPDGDWCRHFSCLIGYNIRTFVLLGFRDDDRVKRSVELLLKTNREDGGYLCDIHEGKYKTRSVKSCIRGAVKALLAFSELPECWDHPRCKQLVDYFLQRGGVFQSTNLRALVNRDMEHLSFPVTWRANLWEILCALGKMGYGMDERLRDAWNELEKKADSEGRYKLDWTPAQCPWKVGKRGEQNKWITFYATLAKSYRDETTKA